MTDSNAPIWAAVPHRRFTIGGITFDAPVAIVYRVNGTPCRPHLQSIGEQLVYAMPGGGRITADGAIL